ncbi:MAG: nitroreductase family protein [Oscillospiraceae bacterium]|jgi:nitroreductase|nr:nitroreductase family protein [Oscillospiraceae bacterium]
MSFSQLIKDRYSVRSFAQTAISADDKAAILEAGRVAPTACNYQPQRFHVFETAEDLQKLDLCSPCRYGAPYAILICYDKSVCWSQPDGSNSGSIDASIATTHMMLQAADLGLGSIWVGMFDAAKLAAEFALPENIVPVALLPLGYPAEGTEPFALHYQRGALDSFLV